MTDLHLSDYQARQEWMQNAALSDLTHHAENIAFNARQVISTPYRLQYQEPFQTRMETAMEEAIRSSRLAIDALEKQLTEYRKLKVRNAA
jgi:hypothetical protein